VNKCKIYVRNLPYSVGFQELKELFSECGEVIDSTVISDRDTGRSKGFGFVTMATKKDATKVIKELDKKEFKGRNISVKPAIPREERSQEKEPKEE